MKAKYDRVHWFGIRPTVNVTETPAAKVTIGTSSTEILDANHDRTAFIIRNTGSVDVYIRLGATATTNDMLLEPGDVIGNDDYTGAIEGIVSSGSGEVRVIEV